MIYVKQDEGDGLWRVYDTECSGVISGPYASQESAQNYCDAVSNNEN